MIKKQLKEYEYIVRLEIKEANLSIDIFALKTLKEAQIYKKSLLNSFAQQFPNANPQDLIIVEKEIKKGVKND